MVIEDGKFYFIKIVKEQVITKALRVVDLAKDGVQIPFYAITVKKL